MHSKAFMYDLDLVNLKKIIDKSEAKEIIIQLPDGLKPKTKEIQQILKKTGKDILFWGGSCFGACDIPLISNNKSSLLVQFGHSRWKNV
jgi:2-(3-amino-3-carboxypropyl)histidine synthase